MNYRSKAVSKNGFTIIEILFSMTISFVALAAIYWGYTYIRSHQSVLDQVIITNTETSRWGARFVKMADASDISVQFSHLPIPSSRCEEGRPCVRKYDAQAQNFIDSYGGVPSIFKGQPLQFYRDQFGVLDNNIPMQFGMIQNTTMTYSRNYDVSQLGENHRLYATWPLIDESSLAFPVLTHTETQTLFQFEELTATSQPKGNTSLFFIKGAAPTAADVQALKESLIVIYNSYDPRHYVFQKIVDLKLCSADITYCQSLLNDAGTVKQLDATNSQQYVAIGLQNINDDRLKDLLPSLSAPTYWNRQNQNYFFPLQVNLYQPRNTDVDGSQPFDVRRWSHFNHTAQLPSQLLLRPVNLSSFKVVKKTVNQVSYNSLVRSDFRFNQPNLEFVEIEKLDKFMVYFARELGTSNFQVYMIQKN